MPVLKDSTRHAFEARLRADWVGSRRVSHGEATTTTPATSGEFSFATTPDAGVAGSERTGEVVAGGFGSPFGQIASTPNTASTGGSSSSAISGEGSSPAGGNAAVAARALGCVGLVSVFTGKYLQARRKRPHRLQFYSDKRGVYEMWEVIGGARSKLGRWRAWGAALGVDALEDGNAEPTTTTTTTSVGSASASVGSARSRFMGDDEMRASLAGLFDLPDVALESLESRDVCVVRSKQSPRRCLLLVRLTLPSGEPVVSHSPSRAEPDSRLGSLSRRSLFSRGTAPAPRRSEGSISFTMQRPGGDDSPSEVRSRRTSRTLESPVRAGSVSGRESQGEVTASLDALDVMSLSNKLLAGFARGRVETRRSQRQAYFAWRAHVREANRLRARAEMVGSLYEKKWRQRLVTAWERRTSELRAKRRNQERMCLRVRQWRARWHWRRCALGFVRWRQLARKSAAGGELLERWARRWLNSAAARCVARWRAHVADIARMRTVARRVVRRMRAVKLSTAFDRWFKRAIDSKRSRATIRVALAAASKTTTRGAFRRWAHVAADARRRARDARRADVLFERRRRAFKADAFFAWSTYRFEKVSARYRFEKVSARWRRLERARPFRAWRESARRVREIRTHLRGTYLADLEHLRRAATRRGFAWWRLWTTATRRRRIDAETVQRTERRLLAVAVGRVRRVVVAAAFDTWRDAIRASRLEARASRFARRMGRRQLASSFQAWRDRVDERVSARERIAVAVARMTASTLTRAFNSWAHATEAAWARRVKGARAERFLSKTLESKTCLARVCKVERVRRGFQEEGSLPRRARAGEGAQGAEPRVAGHVRVEGVHDPQGDRPVDARDGGQDPPKETHGGVSEKVAAGGRLERHRRAATARVHLPPSFEPPRDGARFARWRTYRRAEQRQKLAIARLVRASTYAAFATWRDFAAAQRAFLRRMEKVMRRWLRLSLSYPFERWIESVDERRRVRAVLQKCARRLANRTVAAAFSTWSDAVARRRERGAAERRASNLIRRMTRSTVASAFDRWSDAVMRASAKREAAHRLLTRWLNAHAAYFFDAWAARVRESRSLRVSLRKTLARIRNVKLNAAWNAWMDAARGGRRARRVARRLRNLRGSRTLAGWRSVCERRVAARAVLRRCERFMHRVLTVHLRVAFVAWLDSFRHRRQAARLAFVASRRSRFAELGRRFKRWAAPVKNKRGLNLQVLARAIRMQNARAVKTRCFREWTRAVDDTAVRGDTAVAMRTRHAARRAMRRWRFVAAAGKDRRRGMMIATRRWRGRVIVECFATWVETARSRRRLRRFVARLTGRRLAAGFDAWAVNAAYARRTRRNLRKIAARWRRLQLAAPFGDWVDWVDEVRSNRGTMNRALKKFRRSALFASMSTWRESIGYMRRERALLDRAERVLGRLVLRDASRALVSWRDFVRSRRRLRALLRRWRKRDLDVAFRTWRMRADEIVAQKSALRVAARRMLRHRQAAAFARWLDVVAEGRTRAGNLRKMDTFVRRMANRVASAAFFAWLERAIHSAAARASLERVAIRWTRLALSVPFNDWVDWVDEVQRNRLKVSRFLHRMRTVYSARAFYAWVDARLEMKRQRHVMSRVERYFRRANAQVLSKAFNTWAENASGAKRHRYLLEKIISRWQRLQLATPFNNWVDWVDEVQSNRVKISRFLHRMRTVKTAAAFARWDENRVEMKRQRHVMYRAEGYFRRANAQVLSKAFNTWAENVFDNRRRRYALEKIISRWQRLQLSAPFNDWVDWVDEVRANRVKLSRFLHRMRTVKTAAAFARWDENRVEMKRQRHVMSRAEGYFQRASSRSVTKAFNAWAENAADAMRIRRALERILSRWQRLQLAAPFGDWVDWVDEVQRNRLKVSRFLHRMRTVYSARAFYAWVDAWLDARRQRHAIQRASRFFQRVAKSDYARAFFAWRANASDLRRTKKSLTRLVSRWRRLHLHYPFRAWRDWLDDTLGNRDVLRLVVHRMSRFALFGAFSRWRERIVETREVSIAKRRADVVVEKFVRRASRRELSRAFNRWVESTRIAKRARHSLRKVVARWQRLRLSVPFDDWVEWTEEVKSNRMKISRCVRRLRKATVLAAWARWIEFTGESRRRRVLAARATRCLARLANRVAARAFARWRDSVGRDLRHRAALRKIVIRWQRLQLSASFNDWADWVDEVRANRVKLSRFLHRMRTVKTAAAFARWDENRLEMKRQRHGCPHREVVLPASFVAFSHQGFQRVGRKRLGGKTSPLLA